MNGNIIIDQIKSKWMRYSENDNYIHYVGNIILMGEHNISAKKIFKYLYRFNLLKFEQINKLLNDIDGFFTIIFENNDIILVIGDRVRSYPIFFTHKNSKIFISDNAHILKEKLDLRQQNNIGVLEFLLCGFVTGNETLYQGLKQLLPGQYLIWDKNKKYYKIINYYQYLPHLDQIKYKREINYIDKKTEFKELLFNSFNRLKQFINTNNYQPIVPLSGGIDSRLIAVMLKEVGINNAICFTYGTETHPEVIKSKEVAEKLGFKWMFVKYSKQKWYNEYHNLIKKKYLKYADGLSVKPHFLDFIAVKELFSNQNRNYLFLPGHSLDFLTGSHISETLIENNNMKTSNLIDCIIEKHFCFHYIYKDEKKLIKEKIFDSIHGLERYKSEMIAVFEFFDWIERQGKFIHNSLNVYDFFGYKWYMPFWEKEYMDFFLKIPYEYKYNRYFLLETLNTFFPDYFEKPEKSSNEMKGNVKRKIMYNMKNFLNMSRLDFLEYLYFRKNSYKSLSLNYGLERYGVFDKSVNNLEEFARKYTKTTDIQMIFYFFVLDYLKNNDFNLDFLDKRFLKVFDVLPKNHK